MSNKEGVLSFAQKREKDIRRIQNACLLDDSFMRKAFEDIPCAELLLNEFWERKNLKITYLKPQQGIFNLKGHSVILDVFAEDESGKLYDIEVQRNNEGAIPKRARYNSSLIDANSLKEGESYKNLKETYVIFVTEKDYFGYGKPIYYVERTIVNLSNVPFNDGSHIIYVNASYEGDDRLGDLMHDLKCTNPDKMKFPVLARRVKYLKTDEEGVNSMCKILEEVRNETQKETNRIAIEKLSDTLSVEKLAETFEDFTKEEIEEIVRNSKKTS